VLNFPMSERPAPPKMILGMMGSFWGLCEAVVLNCNVLFDGS
jgi:hypothetical protein